MNVLQQWANHWRVPAEALDHLRMLMMPPVAAAEGYSETGVQSRVRLAASRKGMPLWRNNVGAGSVEGTFLRWGLANESPALNRVCKSADLIGIKPVHIEPAHVGQVIGQFVSYEIKHTAWRWRGDAHEVAQQNWANLVVSHGGDARFLTSENQL